MDVLQNLYIVADEHLPISFQYTYYVPFTSKAELLTLATNSPRIFTRPKKYLSHISVYFIIKQYLQKYVYKIFLHTQPNLTITSIMLLFLIHISKEYTISTLTLS